MNNKLATETCVDYKINSRAEQINDTIDTKAWTFYGTEDITSSANLDDYKEIGNYRAKTNAIAQTLTNCPSTSAFMLKVYDGTGNGDPDALYMYRTQLIESFTGNMYIRTGISNGTGASGLTWGAWRTLRISLSQNYTYGSNGSVITAMRQDSTVTLYVQINTADLGTMTSWQSKNLATLRTEFRFSKSGYLVYPVVHDSAQNTGGCIVVNQSGVVQFATRGGSLPGVATSAWVYATCTYCV